MKTNLQASPSKIRIIISELCIDVVKSKIILNTQQIDDLTFNFWRLCIFHKITNEINENCDCSFIYWYKDILPNCFKIYFKRQVSIHRLYFFCLAISDTPRILKNVKHLNNNTLLLKSFNEYSLKLLTEEVFLKYARELENDLRYHIDSILIDELKKPEDAYKEHYSGIDFNNVISLRKLKLFENTISLNTIFRII